MTTNQALDRLISKGNLNHNQQELKLSLVELKMRLGGNTMIENTQQVENIIEFGNKEGTRED